MTVSLGWSWYHLGSPRSLRLKSVPTTMFSQTSSPLLCGFLQHLPPLVALPQLWCWAQQGLILQHAAGMSTQQLQMVAQLRATGPSAGHPEDPPFVDPISRESHEFPWLFMVYGPNTANNGRQHTPQWQFECENMWKWWQCWQSFRVGGVPCSKIESMPQSKGEMVDPCRSPNSTFQPLSLGVVTGTRTEPLEPWNPNVVLQTSGKLVDQWIIMVIYY